MSSFFTTPKSQKKRKREEAGAQGSTKRSKAAQVKPTKSRKERDESISGSEDELEDGKGSAGEGEQSGSGTDDETAAERRLRLAEQYLDKIKGDVQEEVGFNAEDVDRDLIAERLQEDVAENKGRLYKNIASDFEFFHAQKTDFRMKTASVTSIAVCTPYAYTVSKDGGIAKWELPDPPTPSNPSKKPKKLPKPTRGRPTHIAHISPSTTKASKSKDKNTPPHHTGPIFAIAASSTGKYIATGGLDKSLILYSTSPFEAIKSFSHHRDAITSLTFRQGTNQLFSAGKDRTVKVWAADERAYVETLFGHQDEVVGVDATYAGMERCVSVGARDRTARVWKVVEETQLVFRGGGGGGKKKEEEEGVKTYAEGSIDCVAIVDNETFVTGSDNGSLCLWSLQKKKPVFVYTLAHGLQEPMKPEEASAEMHLGPDFKLPQPQPRWITALKAVPLSDLLVSGSSDGWVRAWRVGKGKRTLEPLGALGQFKSEGGEQGAETKGIVNDLDIFERGERGKEGLCVVAAIGKEHKLGRWKSYEGRSGAVVWEVPRKWMKKARKRKANGMVTQDEKKNTLEPLNKA